MAFRVGIVLVIGGILVSIAIGMFAYDHYKVTPIYAAVGELLQVGPVTYSIEYDGVHDGNDITRPDNVYYQIKIRVKNMDSESTRISNSQFHLTGTGIPRTSPIFSNFSDTDLSGVELLPGQEGVYTTQFDIPHDAESQYFLQIRPTKDQASLDLGIVCLANC